MTQRTKPDWVGGRHRADPDLLVSALRPMFGGAGQWLRLVPRSSGWMGFESSASILVTDMNVGLAAWGGQHQRGWSHLSLTGQGCDWVDDWDVGQDCLDALPAWEPRRVDLALDTFKRETCHEDVLGAYRAGRFNMNGRPPKLTQVISEDPRAGRTIYIGTRASSKFLRCYEKGLQLAEGRDLAAIDGVPVEDWFRVEAELKAKEGPLPEDIIVRRDQYFAGAYPYLQALLSDVEPEILVNTRVRGPQLELQAALDNIRTQYGRTIFTALTAYHGDIGAVMQRIAAREHNEALLRAGVLMVEHDEPA
jgi:phage replication initiation protein